MKFCVIVSNEKEEVVLRDEVLERERLRIRQNLEKILLFRTEISDQSRNVLFVEWLPIRIPYSPILT